MEFYFPILILGVKRRKGKELGRKDDILHRIKFGIAFMQESYLIEKDASQISIGTF